MSGIPSRGNPAHRAQQAYPASDDSFDDQEFPEWFSAALWWPISFLGLCLRLIGRFSKLAFLISISALTYHWFYAWLIPPSLSESHPINFIYPEKTEVRGGGVPANATVDFAFQRQLMVRSGARGMDWSSSSSAGSSLDVGVTLVLPESDANRDLGAFMVTAAVYDNQGVRVGNGTRSMVVRHRSGLLRAMMTTVWGLPLVAGVWWEEQRVSGTVVQLVQLPKQGLHSAAVALSDSRLRVHAATVDIKFVLVGFRYYMYHWYLTSLCVGTGVVCWVYLQLLRWAARQLLGDAPLDVDAEIAQAAQAVQQRGRAARPRSRRRLRTPASPRHRKPPADQAERAALPGGPAAFSPRAPHTTESDQDDNDDDDDEADGGGWHDRGLPDEGEAEEEGLVEDEDEIEEDEDEEEEEEEEWVSEELATSVSDGSGHTPRQGGGGAEGAAEGVHRRHRAVPGPAGSDNPM